MVDIGVNFIPFFESTVFHRNIALEQSHIDFLVGEGTVDDMGVIDHSPHGTPGIVDDLAAVQNDILGGVLGILSIGILVVVMLTGEP